MGRGFEPLGIPVSFWSRPDVCAALTSRDIGGLFTLVRRYTGASQTRIGVAVEIEQSTVSKIMKGSRTVVAIDVWERIADGLGMPDDSRTALGLAPRRTAGVGPEQAAGVAGIGMGDAGNAVSFVPGAVSGMPPVRVAVGAGEAVTVVWQHGVREPVTIVVGAVRVLVGPSDDAAPVAAPAVAEQASGARVYSLDERRARQPG